MSRKGRLSRSKNESSASARKNRASSAPLPKPPEVSNVPPKPLAHSDGGRASQVESRSPQTQTTFASPGCQITEREDPSVPPVDIDAHFFDSAHVAWEPVPELEARDPRVAIKSSPMAARRRAHLAKYVKVAVALSSALCVAAVVKASTTSGHEAPHRGPALAEMARPLEPVRPSSAVAAPLPPAGRAADADGRLAPPVPS
ncbi:MAG: hypothetical protein M3O50_00830, partial [Myxococcota bacterium]|nr:hypothetical protein [Myxococcota bacterium]